MKHISITFNVPDEMDEAQLRATIGEAMEYAEDDYGSCQKAEAPFMEEGDEDSYQKKIDDIDAISMVDEIPEGIKRVIREGELSDPASVPDMLEQAGRLLDKAYSHEIVGEVVFEGEDGNHYVGTTEFVIGVANPEYLKDVLKEEADE